MKFLFVLRENELTWGELIGTDIQGEGGEVTTVTSIEEAKNLLRKKDFQVDEIITGSFGALEGGPWKNVLSAAAERHMGVTLLTGYPVSDFQMETFKAEGVKVLDKSTFDMDKFIAERFPSSGKAESR